MLKKNIKKNKIKQKFFFVLKKTRSTMGQKKNKDSDSGETNGDFLNLDKK